MNRANYWCKARVVAMHGCKLTSVFMQKSCTSHGGTRQRGGRREGESFTFAEGSGVNKLVRVDASNGAACHVAYIIHTYICSMMRL